MTLIIALDALGPSVERVSRLARETCGLAAGYKLGWPNLLGAGARVLEAARKGCPGSLVIADLKLADIGYTMSLIAEQIASSADAVIAHSFVGAHGALDELKQALARHGSRLILVATMSHPGAAEAMDPCLDRLLGVARRVSPWGVVAPATRPGLVSKVRRALGGGVKILSPGIGPQGARPGDALRAGADYEIVGRLITGSPDPRGTAERVLREQRRRLTGEA